MEGLPRGIGLSATLAEYVLRSFDYEVANYPGVRFYSRYVDDGIIVTSDKVDLPKLKAFIEKILPSGLNLNRSKTTHCLFGSYARGASGITDHMLQFLGYSLNISEIIRLNNKYTRNVQVDIAQSKIYKLKRRICKSLLEYNNGGTFNDLLGRIKLLSSNFGFIDESTGQQRYSGIRYNYGLIDPMNSSQLDSLDRFFVNVVTSRHSNNRIRPDLTKSQRAKLLGFGFKSGFIENRFYTFSDEQLKHLIGCWAHA
ncbi:antiviral reverse transcriptase Drt3a [Sphingobium sp. Ant17]|uniref:antiviral reverse transcriptase Drt3a n=1 Tax=Sphingobium sp. Ant17 TaxID=1461752 RepID=UPI0009E097C3